MKKILFSLTLFVCTGASLSAQQKAQADSLGLPGDNLNLYAVLDVFRESETLELFEKKLNQEDSKINNLDLNNDDKTDYIKVVDNKEGNTHLIVLQIDVTDKEKQDVAVISVDRDKDDKVKIQIIGDPDLYGKDYIIEPNDEAAGKKSAENKTAAKSNTKSDTTISADGKTIIINNTTNNYYNNSPTDNSNDDYKPVPPVHQWVIVHYMYAPSYVVYASPWYWGYYPPYWNPWRPLFWHHYYWGFHHHHFHHHHFYYKHSNMYHAKSYSNYYGQRRSVSTNYNEKRTAGTFKNTYSRPDLKKPMARPNPAFQSGPGKNVSPKQPMKPNQPPRAIPGKQPMKNPGMNKPPVQRVGPKPNPAPMQKSGGGGVKRGR